MKPSVTRREGGLAVWLAMILFSHACSTNAPCLQGARVCSGDMVMLCDPRSQSFLEEYRCPPGSDCIAGECLGARFRPHDTSGPDSLVETDTKAPETRAPAPDSSSSDLGAPTVDTLIPEDLVPPDGATPGDTAAADTEPTDTEPTDTEPADIKPTDTGPTDTEPADTEPADTEPAPDTMDSGTFPASDISVDNAPSGVLMYTPIPNLTLLNDITRVAWHPTGAYALVLGTKGQVARIDMASPLVKVLNTLGDQVTDLDVSLSGDHFAIVGRDGSGQGTLWLYSPDTDEVESISIPTGEPFAIAREPGQERVAIAARSGNSINMLYTYDPTSGLSPPKGYNGPGVRDLMWSDPALSPGSASVLTSDGFNGAGSQTWILASNLVISNGWPGGFGNPGGAAWQPDGTYGLFTGTSSNKLYVYDGSWTKATLPAGTAASPNAVGWRSDGMRALIVGRAIGSPVTATVIEHRPAVDGTFTPTFVDQGIFGFDSKPFFGHGNMHLLDVAWRPNTPCDEGLIVGMDNGSAFSPAFGLVIHFYDTADPACVPPL